LATTKNRTVLVEQMGAGWPKKLAPFCTLYNFVKYWPNFEMFSLSESGENLW